MSEARHPARDAFERLHPIALADLCDSDRRYVEETLWHEFRQGWDARAENAADLTLSGRAAVERMRDMINSLDRNGWPLYAHALYLPMVQLEQAVRRMEA